MMGREIRRVPLDFDHPVDEIWPGFLMPETLHEEKCEACKGSGYSAHAEWLHSRWYGYIPFDPAETGSAPFTPQTPAVRAFAERNVSHSPDYYGTGERVIVREAQRLCDLWNGMWSHHLHQDDVDALIEAGRLREFTHRWVQGDGWQPLDPAPFVAAEQVNIWAINGFGHDSINCWVVVRAACDREGKPERCDKCGGHGSHERYAGQRAEAEAWESTGPPTGEGWQLWETVSEGSPVSPVCASAEELAAWMSDPERGDRWVPAAVAAKFIEEGWAPSLVSGPGIGVVSGVEFIGTREDVPSGGAS